MKGFTYNYNISSTINEKVDVERLKTEIEASDITVALESVYKDITVVSVIFKAEISDDEENILNVIVSEHDGTVIDYMTPMNVKVIEESTPTGERLTQGNYQAKSILIDIPSTIGVYEEDISFPYYISIASAQWFCNEENLGDEASMIFSPDTLVGVSIAPSLSGNTTIQVSSTVLGVLQLGYCLTIGDFYLGAVVSIDKETSIVGFTNPLDIDYAAMSYIKMCVPLVEIYHFVGVGSVNIGGAKIGTTPIPPNTVMRISYNNKNGLAKRFAIFIDYSY